MSINIGKVSVLAISACFILVSGCNSSEQTAQQPLPQPPQQQVTVPPQAVPVQPTPVAAAPAAPPATPLMPVGDSTASPAPSTPSKGGSGGGAKIDKPLGGTPTTGEELLGNYTCRIDSKKLQIGPIKLPPFGCKIFKSGEALKVGSTSDGAGSLKGNIKDQTALGFFITGKFEMSGNNLAIKARMKLTKPGQYVGNGRGRLNDDKSAQIKYKLTMTRN